MRIGDWAFQGLLNLPVTWHAGQDVLLGSYGCGAELRTLPKWLARYSAIASAPINAAIHRDHGGGDTLGKKMCSSAPPIAKLARPQMT